jgi:peroxiredoxin
MTFAFTRRAVAAAAFVTIAAGACTSAVAIAPGQAAPAFTATDSNGKAVSLADFAGKTVVLEWTNHDCPFVKKHYGGGNMQALQREAAADGVVWLSVISSAPGKQGHVSGATANELTASRKAAPAHVLLDPQGAIGKAYGARTTPHMYVIGNDGKIAYQGAIDDKNTASPADIPKAKNYVRDALAAVKAGKAPATATSAPYGCSVKYAG